MAAKIAESSGWKPESVRAQFSIVCWRGHDSVALLIKKEEVKILIKMIDAFMEEPASATAAAAAAAAADVAEGKGDGDVEMAAAE